MSQPCVFLLSRTALQTLLQKTVSTPRWLCWLPLVTGSGITTDPTTQTSSRSHTTPLLVHLRVYFTRGLTRDPLRAAWPATPLSDYPPSPSCLRTSRAPSAPTTNSPSPLRLTPRTPMTSPPWRCYLAPCSPSSPLALPPTSPLWATRHQLPFRPRCQVSLRDPPASSTSSRDSCPPTLGRIFHGGASSRVTTSALLPPWVPTDSSCREAWFWDIRTLRSTRRRSPLCCTPSPLSRLRGAAGGAGAPTASRPRPATSPGRRSSTFVTYLVAGKFTGKLLTWKRTWGGTPGSGRLCATGCSVGRVSPGRMSCRDTWGLTLGRSALFARTAARGSWGVTTWQNMSKRTRTKKASVTTKHLITSKERTRGVCCNTPASRFKQ